MSFLNLTSESPSFPNANVPLYPMTMVPAAPSNPVKSVAHGLRGEVGVVAETEEADDLFSVNLGWGLWLLVYPGKKCI